jgi:subtilisin family serine protease
LTVRSRFGPAITLAALITALVAAPLVSPLPAGAQGAPAMGRYVVVLKRDVARPGAVAAELARRHGLGVGRVYGTALKGFAARLPAQAVEVLKRDPRVARIDPDLPVRLAEVPTGVDRVGAENVGGTGRGPGPGVPVAVLDTGIDAGHPDLTVAGGHNCTGDDPAAWGDVHGHGTHVAGIIGADGGVVGVAPGTPLYAVKVMGDDGRGTWSSVICGVDWAAAQGITVGNMSLIGASAEDPDSCAGSALHQAICTARDLGLRFAAGAGNDGQDVMGYAPAMYPEATTVSALADSDGCAGGFGPATADRNYPDDTRAGFSNWGAAVDVAAPGVGIYSTMPRAKGSYGTKSGTSMATPHVAALLALGGWAPESSGWGGEPIATIAGGDTGCRVDTTPPGAPVLTLKEAEPDEFVRGATLFYRPATGQAGTFTVTAQAADAQSGITRVDFPPVFGADGAADTTSPYQHTYAWSAGATASGVKTVVATNGAGLTGQATFTVTPDTAAPSVAITAPAKGATVANEALVTANATDAGAGVARVEFRYCAGTKCAWAKGTAIGSDAAAPYEAAWTVQPSNGTYTLVARAWDHVGNVATSRPVMVKVANTTTTGTTATTATTARIAADTTTARIRGPEPGTAYEYRVAVNAAGRSAPSNAASVSGD